jgi:hypothetical protein
VLVHHTHAQDVGRHEPLQECRGECAKAVHHEGDGELRLRLWIQGSGLGFRV